jgi:hypothetical protein
MKCLWTFVYGIRASRTNAECLHSCQKASDVVEMACEAASHYTACLLKARCASRGSDGVSERRLSEDARSGLTRKEAQNAAIFQSEKLFCNETLGKACIKWLAVLY